FTLAVEQQPGAMACHVCGTAGGFPGMLADRTGGIGHVPPSPSHEMARIAGGASPGMHVGDDLRGTVTESLPLAPGGFEKVEIFGGVNGGARSRTEVFRDLDLVPLALHRFQQALGSFRLLGTRLRLSADQEEGRIVTGVPRIVDDFHLASPAAVAPDGSLKTFVLGL